jgi:membrane-bound serine protease (ClpP class)
MLLPIVLLIVGLAFVVAEVFFVSMGALTLMALVCIIGADVLAFGQGQAQGWVLVAVEIVCVPLLVWLAFRVLPHVPFGRRMLLTGPATEPGGGFESLDRLVGRDGEAVTDLRPAGTVAFDGERHTVVSVGGMVPRGSRVRVVKVVGPEVRVRATELAGDEDA